MEELVEERNAFVRWQQDKIRMDKKQNEQEHTMEVALFFLCLFLSPLALFFARARV